MFTLITVFLLVIADYAQIPMTEAYPEDLIGKRVVYEGEVAGIEKQDEEKLSLKVKVLSADGKTISGKQYMLLNCYERVREPWRLWKGKIAFKCAAELPNRAKNPGCFDYRKHLLSRGINVTGYTDSISLIREADSVLHRCQKKLMEFRYGFAGGLKERTRGIVMGMMFGDTSFMDDDIYENFRINGTTHVLAVSGLHVGILYQWIKKIAGRRQNLFSLSVTWICLAVYCFLSSFSISAVRASVMIMISSYGAYKDRRYDMLTAGSTAALLFMAENPYVLFNTGFQMSFIAVCSIAFFYKHTPKKLPRSAAVMISVNAGLMPYQIYVFNWISLSSFVINIPVVYLATITVPFAMLQFILYCAAGKSKFLELITDSLSDLIIKLNDLASAEGKAGFDTASPSLWIIFFIYFIMFFLASEQFEILKSRGERRKIKAVFLVFLVISIFAKVMWYQPIGHCDLIFVDVGQGDCVHIRSGKTNILIDGGGRHDYNMGKNTLKPYLLKNGVTKIDMGLATHKHTDHFKGLEELKEENMLEDIRTGLTAGKVLLISDRVYIETLWPVSIDNDREQDENASCSVFMIHFHGYRILVTGDLDGEGERKMVNYYGGSDKLNADILKIGHHGSSTSTTDRFLDAVRPQYAVIQVGKNNYGHPDVKIIEKCHEKGIIVLRNDINGAVGFSFKPEEIQHFEMIEESQAYGIRKN